jgi:hypothetical protein
MERPNTVAGLLAKRAELAGKIKFHEAELRKLICDVDHLDAAIRLFDAEPDTSRVARYPTAHRAKKGTLQRFVLAYLRDATEPATSRQMTEAWIAQRGLDADPETFVLLRKRLGACLTALKARGMVREVPLPGDYKGWELP